MRRAVASVLGLALAVGGCAQRISVEGGADPLNSDVLVRATWVEIDHPNLFGTDRAHRRRRRWEITFRPDGSFVAHVGSRDPSTYRGTWVRDGSKIACTINVGEPALAISGALLARLRNGEFVQEGATLVMERWSLLGTLGCPIELRQRWW